MCVTSAVLDYGRRSLFPAPWPVVPWMEPGRTAFPPNEPLKVLPTITKEQLDEFMKLYVAAKEYDKSFDEPECEDPEKAKILESIAKRLEELQEEVKKLRGV